MANIIDLYSMRQPSLQLVLQSDSGRQMVHLTVPTVRMVNRVHANAEELQQALDGNADAARAVYAVAAELINGNADGLTTTGEELATKYDLSISDMVMFFRAYVDFLQQLSAAKN